MELKLLPTKSDLNKIEKWLINGGCFYCNWNVIKKAFHKGNLLTLNHKNIVVGFVVWCGIEPHAQISIMEIKPGYRNKGNGRVLFYQVSEFLKKEGFLPVKILCRPVTSKGFWEKMGFTPIPDTESNYYKSLI
jgi:GNAT superfamily N-acetyltransferase